MRWHEKLGLPVYRVPGGARAPVHAYTGELDRWLASGAALAPPEPEASSAELPVPAPMRRRFGRSGFALAIGVSLCAAATLLAWPSLSAMVSPLALGEQSALGGDTQLEGELRDRFLAARRLWAGRSPASLIQATQEFEAITAEAPQFAPGWAALAESWLLSREFGAVSDAEAFAEAEVAARQAVAIDPNNAAGHRALGFLQYWNHADPRAAGRSFREAIALAAGDAQNHFWYGNILSDNGQHKRALYHLAQAQTLDPGNVSLEVDYAWALWQAGSSDAASRLFTSLEASNPDHAVLRSCLADMALIARDWPRYLEEYERYTVLRNDPAGQEKARALRSVLETSGEAPFKAALLRIVLAETADGTAPTLAWPATVASAVGDRAELVKVLRQAAARQERWGSSGYRRAIGEHWAGDSEIARLLAAVAPPSVEPAGN